MENIFKEAKFGDRFRTRDGRMAIYHYKSENPTHNGKYDAWHYLIVANEDAPLICLSNGRFVGGKTELNDDIVGRWKDDTIRDIIKKEIERANRYYDQKLSSTQMAASIRVVSVLSELIGEKFPYEELHMGFATMD